MRTDRKVVVERDAIDTHNASPNASRRRSRSPAVAGRLFTQAGAHRRPARRVRIRPHDVDASAVWLRRGRKAERGEQLRRPPRCPWRRPPSGRACAGEEHVRAIPSECASHGTADATATAVEDRVPSIESPAHVIPSSGRHLSIERRRPWQELIGAPMRPSQVAGMRRRVTLLGGESTVVAGSPRGR